MTFDEIFKSMTMCLPTEMQREAHRFGSELNSLLRMFAGRELMLWKQLDGITQEQRRRT